MGPRAAQGRPARSLRGRDLGARHGSARAPPAVVFRSKKQEARGHACRGARIAEIVCETFSGRLTSCCFSVFSLPGFRPDRLFATGRSRGRPFKPSCLARLTRPTEDPAGPHSSVAVLASPAGHAEAGWRGRGRARPRSWRQSRPWGPCSGMLASCSDRMRTSPCGWHSWWPCRRWPSRWERQRTGHAEPTGGAGQRSLNPQPRHCRPSLADGGPRRPPQAPPGCPAAIWHGSCRGTRGSRTGPEHQGGPAGPRRGAGLGDGRVRIGRGRGGPHLPGPRGRCGRPPGGGARGARCHCGSVHGHVDRRSRVPCVGACSVPSMARSSTPTPVPVCPCTAACNLGFNVLRWCSPPTPHASMQHLSALA